MAALLDRWFKKQKEAKLKKTEPAPAPDASVKVAPVSGQKAAPEKVEAAKEVNSKVGGVAYRILIRPLVTEKAAVAESFNKYSFVVARHATKEQIKQAIAEAYGVTPAAVNVVNVDGKRVRFGRMFGRRSDFKKAIVTLPTGQTISIHEGV